MNDYSMHGHARERQIYWLAAVAFSVMPLLTSLSGWLGVTISVGTATVFGLLFWLFDRHVWRWWPVRVWLGFPNLNGTWKCVGHRLNDDGSSEEEWQGDMSIIQTWSRLSATLRTGRSLSKSGPASLIREDGVGYCLLYTYVNEPEPNQADLHIHRGTCELRFDDTCAEATGFYFTDRHRLTFGRLTLSKQAVNGKDSH